jgi:hypothetical protein
MFYMVVWLAQTYRQHLEFYNALPSISFINLVCNNSSGSYSLHFKADSKPKISQQYNEIGNIRESKSFSNSLQGLFKPIVFFILKYAFLAKVV